MQRAMALEYSIIKTTQKNDNYRGLIKKQKQVRKSQNNKSSV